MTRYWYHIKSEGRHRTASYHYDSNDSFAQVKRDMAGNDAVIDFYISDTDCRKYFDGSWDQALDYAGRNVAGIASEEKNLAKKYEKRKSYGLDSLKEKSMTKFKIGNKMILAKDAVSALKIYKKIKGKDSTKDMAYRPFRFSVNLPALKRAIKNSDKAEIDKMIDTLNKDIDDYNSWKDKLTSADKSYFNQEINFIKNGLSNLGYKLNKINDSKTKDAKQYFVMHRRLWNKGLAEDGKTWVEVTKAKKFNSSDEATEFARQNAPQGKFEEWRVGILDSIKDVNPQEGESKDDFINRFMSETSKEYPDKKQRFAVALSYWKKAKDSVKDSILVPKIWKEEDFNEDDTDKKSTKEFWENFWKEGIRKQTDKKAFFRWIDSALDYAENDLKGYIKEEVIRELQSAKLAMRDSVKDEIYDELTKAADACNVINHILIQKAMKNPEVKQAIKLSHDLYEELNKLKRKGLIDSVKDVYSTEQRLKELQEIKKKRALTEEEWEEYQYCENEISSREAETRYLNGEDSCKDSTNESLTDDDKKIGVDDILKLRKINERLSKYGPDDYPEGYLSRTESDYIKSSIKSGKFTVEEFKQYAPVIFREYGTQLTK